MVRVRRKSNDMVNGLAGFAATMLLMPVAIGRLSGRPESAALEAKWADFEQSADDCDIVFIGTSHVERHIDPHVVDQALSEPGREVRSYNLGLPKMSMLEGAELIERIAHRRPRRLKLVVLEPTLYLYDAENWATDRAMAEHDWPGTWLATRLTWASEARRKTGVWGKLKCVAPHWLSFLCRSFGLRSGDRLFAGHFPGQVLGQCRVRFARSSQPAAGFAPLPVTETDADRSGWKERFARFMHVEQDWNGVPLSDDELAYFEHLIDVVQQTGARPVFLLGPKVKRDSHTAAVYASHRHQHIDATLLDHLRGDRDADIYELRYWHDFDHLNADGAALFSRQLAADLAVLLDPPVAFVTEIAFPARHSR
jgi:hypothetical protein